ncbi:hypothetical protein [uncultured Croceitalea sp.]|uniref:hypothetical protein n=1 Tax=uncultured Croceitalea sp. TaxID=1798908 RepID=UPI0033059E77
MATYKLDIAFTNDQLESLYQTNSSVIIAKPSEGQSTPNVAWQSFKALPANTLTWQEEYGIYVSNTEMVHGAQLDQLSSTEIGAIMDQLYTMEPSGVITGPESFDAPNSFALLNEYKNQSYMTVGLFQDANVNGTDIIGNATSAAPVLLASTAVMTPYTTVYVWIQSQVVSNTVCTLVTSPMTELKFGGGVNDISVAYNSESGKFYTPQS